MSFLSSSFSFHFTVILLSALLVGLIDGSIAVRSSVLNLLFIIPNNICNTKAPWGLQSLGQVRNEVI